MQTEYPQFSPVLKGVKRIHHMYSTSHLRRKMQRRLFVHSAQAAECDPLSRDSMALVARALVKTSACTFYLRLKKRTFVLPEWGKKRQGEKVLQTSHISS